MRILVVEDDPGIAAGLQASLRQGGHACDVCATLDSAWGALKVEPFDAVLLDLGLPDGDGMDLLARIRRQPAPQPGRDALPRNDLPVLIMTARDGVDDRITGLDGGADDYLVKPFAPEELAARLRVVLRRQQGGPQGLKLQPALIVDLAGRRVWSEGELASLTAREWTLLEALALRAGRWVSKDDLDRLVHGFDGEPASSNALEVHVAKLRRKLGRDSIETLRGMGYRVQAHD